MKKLVIPPYNPHNEFERRINGELQEETITRIRSIILELLLVDCDAPPIDQEIHQKIISEGLVTLINIGNEQSGENLSPIGEMFLQRLDLEGENIITQYRAQGIMKY